MHIWIVNPFEEFPVNGTRALRYGTLCRVLAERGHDVTWWSSDFSHLTKKFRPVPPEEEGFAYRLISTPSYKRHVGLGRWRNHRALSRGFFRAGRQAVESGEMKRPDLIVVSLPPLGIVREAFRLRELWDCRVVVDIVDAWPETFLRLIPGGDSVGRLLLKPLFAEAARAYRGADGIAAVARSFLDLPKRAGSEAPLHLTYLGGELERDGGRGAEGQREEGTLDAGETGEGENVQRSTPNAQRSKEEKAGKEGEAVGREPARQAQGRPITHNQEAITKFVYIGAMARSYDLETVVRAAAKLKDGGCHFEVHLAGAGPKEPWLKEFVRENGLEEFVLFRGYFGAGDLKKLLAESQVAINPIFDDSWIVFPYKMSEYIGAGLAVINSLSGEVKDLLAAHDAGSWYPAGDAERLAEAMRKYCDNSELAVRQGRKARSLAEREFDRAKTYPQLAEFLEGVARKRRQEPEVRRG